MHVFCLATYIFIAFPFMPSRLLSLSRSLTLFVLRLFYFWYELKYLQYSKREQCKHHPVEMGIFDEM